MKVTRKNRFLSYIIYLGVNYSTVLPEYTSSFMLASINNNFLIDKIHTIKIKSPLLEACLPLYSFVDIAIMPACKTTCVLVFPNKLLMSHLFSSLNIIICTVNLCFSSGVFPTFCKTSIILIF